jgi:hypothetical protein
MQECQRRLTSALGRRRGTGAGALRLADNGALHAPVLALFGGISRSEFREPIPRIS